MILAVKHLFFFNYEHTQTFDAERINHKVHFKYFTVYLLAYLNFYVFSWIIGELYHTSRNIHKKRVIVGYLTKLFIPKISNLSC